MVLFLFSRWNDFLIQSTGIPFFFFCGLFGSVFSALFGLMGLSLGVCNAYACIYSNELCMMDGMCSIKDLKLIEI